MDDKPDIVSFGIAFGFGAIVPAGGLYFIPTVFPAGSGDGSLSLGLPFVWLALIALGAIVLGSVLRVPTDALLGGGIIGAIVGFGVFATLVGWSFVMVAIVPIAVATFVVGSWIAYEWNRRTGVAEEPSYGTWRLVFLLLTLFAFVIPAIVLVV